MITLVRRFSITLEGSSEFLPVLFIQENAANQTLNYCVVSSKGEQLFIDPTNQDPTKGSRKVTSIRVDDEDD